jgi:uncharacterized repeat protein (TIGR03803 family)
MKTGMTLLCGAVLLALGALSAAQAQSSAFDTLYSFTATSGSDSNNLDGASPEVVLLLSGDTLYGAAIAGGTAGNGAIFGINTNGLGFTNIHSFTASATNSLGSYTNSDGANPSGGLILSGNALFGTTANGGTGGSGTVFRVNTDGSDFTNLHSFSATSGSPSYTNSDGANPVAGLVLVGSTLYGTAQNGGSAGNGTVFKVNIDSTGFSLLHTFSMGTDEVPGTYVNNDGAIPVGTLIASGNTLFGTAEYGGAAASGTVFSININNSSFTNLHSFSATTYNAALGLNQNNDGAFPVSALVLSGGTLYGTAQSGGLAGTGTLFSLQTNNGVGFSTLHSFSAPAYDASQGDYTNADGFFPLAPLVLSGNLLFGTAEDGGSADLGTVFRLNITNLDFTNLYNFPLGKTNAANLYTNSSGALPVAGLILLGNTLYGTAALGGLHGEGTVFALNLPPPPSLAIAPSSNQVVISWPVSASAYVLQTTTNLGSGSWSNITNGIATAGANKVFTNAAGSQAAFFRLQEQ